MASSRGTTLSESRLAAAWSAIRAGGHPALIPYLTAGHPDLRTSEEAFRVADDIADILEVGVPFSDPLADGPVIQRSTFAALRQGMTLTGALDLVDRLALRKPVVLFSYLNPVLQYGVDRFLADAGQLGIAGLLLTDLPAGGDPPLEAKVRASSLDLVRLIAPTTTAARLAEAVSGAGGFLYLVARLGVTGASRNLAGDLAQQVARVRAVSPLPIAVGFGISTPAQAAEVAGLADGVVVGSALVDLLEREGVAAVRRFLEQLRAALDRSKVAA
jgi:tryptophan synthase alpha chain